MASAPLNWLLKIGGATLNTAAQTLSEAVNWLYAKTTELDADVSNLKKSNNTINTTLNNLNTNKLNVSALLSLAEIEASTSLTGKGVTAQGVKTLSSRLGNKVSYGGNASPSVKLDIRHTQFATTITNLAPQSSVAIEYDMSAYGYKSLAYAMPQIVNKHLRIVFSNSESTASKAVFYVINNGTTTYTGGIYPDVLFFGII